MADHDASSPLLSLAVWMLPRLLRAAVSGSPTSALTTALDAAPNGALTTWPTVAAIIPARDEAASIAAIVAAHIERRIISGDFTHHPGRRPIQTTEPQTLRATLPQRGPIASTVINGAALPAGWSGKLVGRV